MSLNLRGLIHYLRSCDPGFLTYSPSIQWPYAWLLLNCSFLRHHSGVQGEFPIHRDWVADHFRPYNCFKAMNEAAGYFVQIAPGYEGVAARWTLSAKGIELLNSYFTEVRKDSTETAREELKGYAKVDGSRWTWPSAAIASRTATGGNTAWKGENVDKLSTSVTLDGNGLVQFMAAVDGWLWDDSIPRGFEWVRDLYDSLSDAEGNNAARIRAQRAKAQALVLFSAGQASHVYGCTVPAHYVEAASGRLYSEGLSLQNAMREVKKAALRGCYDLDVENCHYSLLGQKAKRAARPVPAIDRYNVDRKAFRLKIVEDTGLSIDSIKTALISMIYGAKMTAHYSTIEDIFGHRASEFLSHPDVKLLQVDLENCQREVVAAHHSSRRGYVENDMGKAMSIADNSSKQLLAFILQGAEAQVLSVIVNTLSTSIRVLQHDGVVLDARPDIDPLIAAIESETGYKVSFELERL